MTQPPDHPFDDPALKAALGRALDRDAAPAGLRDRIRAAASAAAEPKAIESEAPAPIRLRQPSPWYRFAAAAILVVGFGLLGYRIWEMNRSPQYPPTGIAYVVPNSLYKGMIDTHQKRASGAAEPGDAVTTLAAAPTLSATTGRPTFVADLTQDGWKFEGGAVRQVAAHTAAHLYFTKGNAAVSVFSLPTAAAPSAKEGATYDTVFAGVPIAGFMHKGGLFCIVGTSPDESLHIDEVKALLERHRDEVAKG